MMLTHSTPSTMPAGPAIAGDNNHRVSELLAMLYKGELQLSGAKPAATGFQPLDSVLDGGFLPGEVVILGGLPGVGKTICALQWARNVALGGRRSSYVCFEHDEPALLQRLVLQEMAANADDHDTSTRILTRNTIRDLLLGLVDLETAIGVSPLAQKAFTSVHDYAARLQLVRASSQRTTPEELERLVGHHLHIGDVLFVDYLQKLPIPDVPNLEERVYRAVESLKEFAMSYQISVVALSAAAPGGIGTDRLRLEHLRGSDALGHESDVAIVMNHKVTATSERHLKFDLTKIDEARRRAVFSIEKNRRGEVDVHIEFEKDFANFRFNPDGRFITEALDGD